MSFYAAVGLYAALFGAGFAQPRGSSEGGVEGIMMVLGAAGAVVVGFIILIIIIKRFLYICGPHEVLVFAGRKDRLKDGTVSNFTIIQGGRGFRRPFVETVRRMDIRLFPVEVVVNNAYSAGQIPLVVHAIGNVKISSNPVEVRNAAERFLNQHPSQIAIAAQQTLEGVLREVVSQLTPEQVNEDRLKFASELAENAHDDLSKLGLELDVLKIQNVSDEQEYLSNLGRGRIAKMLRDAENAENAAKQAIAEANASSRQRAETAQKKADTAVVAAKNTADAELAKLEAQAKRVENQAKMATETARATAEQTLQQLRAELEQLRLRNDIVLPAEAKAKAAELKAQGEAAPAVENGKAAAAALKAVASEWAAAGEVGRDVFVLNQLRTLAQAAGKRVGDSQVGSIKLVAGDDQAYGTVLASHAAAVARVLEETCAALGVDIGRIFGRSPGGGPPPRSSRPPLRAGSTQPGGSGS